MNVRHRDESRALRARQLDDLLDEPANAATMARDEARDLLLALAPVVEMLRLRALEAEPVTAPAPDSMNGAVLLSPAEAAEMLKKPRSTIWRLCKRADWQPFVRRLDRKGIRIEKAGLDRWLARQAR